MTPTYIGVMPGRMPALKPLDALDGKAEPVLFLLYRILRPQRYAPEAGNGENAANNFALIPIGRSGSL